MSTLESRQENLKPICQDACRLCGRNLESHEKVAPVHDGPRWLGWAHLACPPYETAIDARARELARSR